MQRIYRHRGFWFVFLGLSSLLALIGQFGRIVADEYCNCARLLDSNPWEATVYLYQSWGGEFFHHLMVLTLSNWITLSFGQGAATALALLLVFWSLWAFMVQAVKFSRRTSLRTNTYLNLGAMAFAIVIGMALPSHLPKVGFIEKFTQQAAISEIFLRYPGLVVALGVNLLLLATLIQIFSRLNEGQGSRLQLTTYLGFLSVLAGLSHYLAAGIFAGALAFLVILSSISTRRIGSLPPLISITGLTLGVLVSFFSPGSQLRKSLLAEGHSTVQIEDRLYQSLVAPVWTIFTIFTWSALLVAVVSILLGVSSWRQATLARENWCHLVAFGIFVLFFIPVLQYFAALNSYAAAWHTLLPRALVLALLAGFFFLIGRLAGRRIGTRDANHPSVKVSLVTVVLVTSSAFALTWSGASQLPSEWAKGPLPIYPIRHGDGSSYVLSDTENPYWRECYERIHPRLSEQKTYLGLN